MSHSLDQPIREGGWRMIKRYYTIVEAAAFLQIHPEYVRSLLARLPHVSLPAYRRLGSHPRRVRVLPEQDVRLLQNALIRVTARRRPQAKAGSKMRKQGKRRRAS